MVIIFNLLRDLCLVCGQGAQLNLFE